MAEPFLTTEEVARLSGYKVTYIRNMVQQNRIPHYKRGGVRGRTFFLWSEVQKALEYNKIPTINELIQWKR